MNILVTLDSHYVEQLRVMLTSLLHSNPGESFDLYIAHSSLTNEDLRAIRRTAGTRCRVREIAVQDTILAEAPVLCRYPREMYYRLFAARFLPPEVDRALYLDPDLVVLNPLDDLYGLEMGDCFFAAASHVHEQFRKLNEIRLQMPEDCPYFNSGVLLMNLEALRREQQPQEVLDYIEKNRNKLWLPDQDIINAVYGGRIRPVSPLLYNLDEKYFSLYNMRPRNPGLTLEWVRRHTVIVHYCGRNKPWKKNYRGSFDCFYHEFRHLMEMFDPAKDAEQDDLPAAAQGS